MRESRSGQDLPLGAQNIEGSTQPTSLRQDPAAIRTDQVDANGQPILEPVNAKKKKKSAIQEVIETLLLAVLIFVGVRSVVLNFRVDGQSMEPNLKNGEMLIVNRHAYAHFNVSWLPWRSESSGDWYPFGKVSRGDIVVFDPPIQHAEPYIKRVIGLPGDRVSVHNGAVYINDQRLDERYIPTDTEMQGRANHDIEVQPGYIFVMGDNRNNSSDSRVFGLVPLSSVIGKAWVAYWPPSQAELIRDPAYSFAN